MGQHSKDNTKYTLITVCGQWLGTSKLHMDIGQFCVMWVLNNDHMNQHNYLMVLSNACRSVNASIFLVLLLEFNWASHMMTELNRAIHIFIV